MAAPEVRFDDLETLSSLVTEAWTDFGPPLSVTQEMIDRFADVTGDQQWIHQDTERCRRDSPFGGPVAHGFLIVSLIGTLEAEMPYELTGFETIVNYGADKLRFISPVPAGAKIHARRRLVHVRKKGPDGTQLTVETEVHIVGADKPALLYKSLVLFLP